MAKSGRPLQAAFITLVQWLFLTMSLAASAEGAEFLQIWRYFGGLNKGVTSHILMRKTVRGYRPHFSEYLTGYGSATLYWENSSEFQIRSDRQMQIRLQWCRNQLRRQLAFPLEVMAKHRLLDAREVAEQMQIANALSDDQITVLELLVDDETLPAPQAEFNSPTEDLPSDAVYFLNKDASVRKFRKSAVSWVVNAQANAKNYRAPLESVFALDRRKYPNVFEIGKSALNEALPADSSASLDRILPALSLEILRQVVIQNLKANDSHVFAHSMKPATTRLYRGRYGLRVIAEPRPGEAILTLPWPDFLRKFPPEKASANLARHIEMTGGKLNAAEALSLLWDLRKFSMQGFEPASAASMLAPAPTDSITFYDQSPEKMSVYGTGLRRQFIERRLRDFDLAEDSVRRVTDRLFSQSGFPYGGPLPTGGTHFSEVLDGVRLLYQRQNVVEFKLSPDTGPLELGRLRQMLLELKRQISGNANDPGEWFESQTAFGVFGMDPLDPQSATAAVLKLLPASVLPLPGGERTVHLYSLKDLWQRVASAPSASDPLVPSQENIRMHLLSPHAF